jgi:hypothetical protein
MWILVVVALVIATIALREFVFVPFKKNPYEYAIDSEGNEYVKDNTKDERMKNETILETC